MHSHCLQWIFFPNLRECNKFNQSGKALHSKGKVPNFSLELQNIQWTKQYQQLCNKRYKFIHLLFSIVKCQEYEYVIKVINIIWLNFKQ